MRHRFSLLLAASAPFALAACGASYQSVYEGDVRFEHCYRLDSEPGVSSQARLGCWSDWTAHHTLGQTRDRVEYALSRERVLRGGDTRLAGPSLVTGIEATRVEAIASGPSIATPLPTSAFEAPPITQAPVPSASLTLVANKLPPPQPELTAAQQCVQQCGNTFTSCATACKKPACMNKCGETAKMCIARCQ